MMLGEGAPDEQWDRAMEIELYFICSAIPLRDCVVGEGCCQLRMCIYAIHVLLHCLPVGRVAWRARHAWLAGTALVPGARAKGFRPLAYTTASDAAALLVRSHGAACCVRIGHRRGVLCLEFSCLWQVVDVVMCALCVSVSANLVLEKYFPNGDHLESEQLGHACLPAVM